MGDAPICWTIMEELDPDQVLQVWGSGFVKDTILDGVKAKKHDCIVDKAYSLRNDFTEDKMVCLEVSAINRGAIISLIDHWNSIIGETLDITSTEVYTDPAMTEDSRKCFLVCITQKYSLSVVFSELQTSEKSEDEG